MTQQNTTTNIRQSDGLAANQDSPKQELGSGSINPYRAPNSSINPGVSAIRIPYFKAWLIFSLIAIVIMFVLQTIVTIFLPIFGLTKGSISSAQIMRLFAILNMFIASLISFKWVTKKFLVHPLLNDQP